MCAQFLTANIFPFNYQWIVVPTVGYLCYWLNRYFTCYKYLPPGPIGYPWVGYIPCLGKHSFQAVQKLYSEYGPIVSFRLCGQLIVVLNDLKSIQDATVENRSWLGRHTMLTNHLLANNCGISNYDDEKAISLRRALVRAIHCLMPSKPSKQNIIKNNDKVGSIGPSVMQNTHVDNSVEEEIEKLIQTLRQNSGKPTIIETYIRILVWRIVWNVVFGSKCVMTENEIVTIVTNIAKNNSVNGPFQFKQMLPLNWSTMLSRFQFVRKLFGLEEIWTRYAGITKVITDSIKKAMEENSLPDNCLLAQILKSEQEKILNKDIYRVGFELMAAGVDTTTLTIMWACQCLASGVVSVSPDNNFTSENLKVVCRKASVVPMALPHVARYENTIGGFLIPKGTIVFFNIFAVHQSQLESIKTKSECPMKANAILKINEETSNYPMVAFSMGARACPGSHFAQRLILRLMTRLVHEFNIQLDKNDLCKQSIETGLTRCPLNQLYIFEPIKSVC